MNERANGPETKTGAWSSGVRSLKMLSISLSLSLSISISISHSLSSRLAGNASAALSVGDGTRKRRCVRAAGLLLFFFTLVTGPRRSLSLKLSDTRVYAAGHSPLNPSTLLLAIYSKKQRDHSGQNTRQPHSRLPMHFRQILIKNLECSQDQPMSLRCCLQ